MSSEEWVSLLLIGINILILFDYFIHSMDEIRTDSEDSSKHLSLWMRHAQQLEQLCNPTSPTCMNIANVQRNNF